MKASDPVKSLSSEPPAGVAHIVSTPNRLREVRKASRQFLLLWNLEQGNPQSPVTEPEFDSALTDPANHDWSLLYQGSVLDD